MSTPRHRRWRTLWSVLRNLAAQPENFRAVGRERAQCLCADLADFAWAALLPPEESQQPKAASSAARLLTRLMVNFPYALPEHALATLLVNLDGLAKRCTPSAAGSAVFPAGIALLHQLWAAANSVLRRQAADCAELLWQAPRVQSPGGAARTATSFVQSTALHDCMDWVLTVSDQPELLVQVVQFCRLLQRLSRLLDTSLPARIEDAIGGYIWRELRSASCSGRATPFRSAAPPIPPHRAPLASNYDVLCVLDLAAACCALGRQSRRRARAMAAQAAAMASLVARTCRTTMMRRVPASGARKRPRIDDGFDLFRRRTRPSWLVWLLGLQKHTRRGRLTL